MTGREPTERALMDLIYVCARRTHNVDLGDLPDRVAHRLELGQRRFGDSFLSPSWNGPSELVEEIEDGLAYIVLTLQAAYAQGHLNRDLCTALIAAGGHLFAADHHVRQAIDRRAAEQDKR